MKYLVPHNFNDSGKNAFHFAQGMCKKSNGNISLLHVVKKSLDIPIANMNLQKIINSLDENDKANIDFYSATGNLFQEISEVANETDSSFVIMGTNDSAKIQNLFKSRSLRVISKSDIPFVLTRVKFPKNGIRKILFAYYYREGSLSVLPYIVDLANRHKSSVILAPFRDGIEENDEIVERSTDTIENILTKQGISYESIKKDVSENYEEEIMSFSKKYEVDVIAATYFQDSVRELYYSFLSKLISNDGNIPVLTVQSKTAKKS